MNIEYSDKLKDFLEERQLGLDNTTLSDRLNAATPNTTGIRKLKGTMWWPLLKPARIVYNHIRLAMIKCRVMGFVNAITSIGAKGRRKTYDKEYIMSILPDEEEKKKESETVFPKAITFSILVPLYNTPDNYLRDMIDSVVAQTYGRWQLCLADGSDEEHGYVGEISKEYAAKDSRVVYKKLEKNLGISENTNVCIKMATGEFISFFDHDDILHPSALYEVMKKICEEDADFVYTDEATFNGNDMYDIISYHFKPDFAIDNLRANNYICHFTSFEAALIDKVGMFSTEYDGSQDHDMILRLTKAARHVAHVPKLLYFWRSHKNSVSLDINSKTYAIEAGKKAVRDSILRDGMKAEVNSSPAFPTIYKIDYELAYHPKVSIIIPNKDSLQFITTCIDSVLKMSTYDNFEIIVVENGTTDEEVLEYYGLIEAIDCVRVVEWTKPFNYSAINNYAASLVDGEYLLFLNNDIEIVTPNWIEELLMYGMRSDVGAVGAKLSFGDDRIQHNGVIIGAGPDGIAIHSHAGEPNTSVGYMGRLYYAQDVSAVTAACMLMRKSLFDEIGGFDEQLAVAYNDVDLCLNIRKLGYLIVCNPFATAYHYESISRGYDVKRGNRDRFQGEVSYMKDKWRAVLDAEDPFYNPNMSKLRPWKFGIDAL